MCLLMAGHSMLKPQPVWLTYPLRHYKEMSMKMITVGRGSQQMML